MQLSQIFSSQRSGSLLQSLSLATMETKLYNIFKSLEESVEQIKRSGLNDVDATNNVIQHAQNLLANIKPPMSEKEAENNSRKRKLDDTSPTDEDEPQPKKARLDLAVIPYHARSAYAIFLAEKREEFRAEDPTATYSNGLIAPALQKRRQIWENMTREERGIYNQKSAIDQERYERESAEYIAKGGKMTIRQRRGGVIESDSEEGATKIRRPTSYRRLPGAPKRPLSAYLLYNLHVRPNFPPGMSFMEKANQISAQWKNMTDEEKQPFIQKAALEQERYDREMKEFQERMPAQEQLPKNEKKTGRKSKNDDASEKESDSDSDSESEADTVESDAGDYGSARKGRIRFKRDPHAPRRGKNAYMFWSEEIRASMPAELTVVQKMKMCGERWKSMSSEDKQPWEQKAALDRERYEREMRAYQEKEQSTAASTKKTRKMRRGRKDSSSDDEDEVTPPAPKKEKKASDDEEDDKPTRRSGRRSAATRNKK